MLSIKQHKYSVAIHQKGAKYEPVDTYDGTTRTTHLTVMHGEPSNTLLMVRESLERGGFAQIPQSYLFVVAATNDLGVSAVGQQAGNSGRMSLQAVHLQAGSDVPDSH